jgi:octaprenyl-diphosphate synthase
MDLPGQNRYIYELCMDLNFSQIFSERLMLTQSLESDRPIVTLNEYYRPIEQELAQIRDRLTLQLRTNDPQIDSMLAHVSQYQGKLLRPAILLLSARACGRIKDEHIAFGVIVELLHMATLIHDDVLDQAKVRRNSATANELWGNEPSVLLGDTLLSQAFDLSNRSGNPKTSRIISDIAKTICRGELLQCLSRGDWTLSETRYLEIIRMKTACFFQMCCRIGAELAGGSPTHIDALSQYGRMVGQAFQIADDLLDITGAESQTGKTLGSDLAQAKPTLPTIHYCRQAAPDARHTLIDLINKNKKDEILPLLERSGSLKYTNDKADELIRQAKEKLKNLEASPAGQSLARIADFVIKKPC